MRSIAMPLFYLHVCNGNGFVADEEGQEFADLAAARAEAVRSAVFLPPGGLCWVKYPC